jgi:hypothetical protein
MVAVVVVYTCPKGRKEVKNMKVKNFPNWRKVVFNDRVLLKSDLRYMSWQQVRALDEMEAILEEDGGATLIVENR